MSGLDVRVNSAFARLGHLDSIVEHGCQIRDERDGWYSIQIGFVRLSVPEATLVEFLRADSFDSQLWVAWTDGLGIYDWHHSVNTLRFCLS